jgi:CSLREA domain-containing protein
MFPVKITARVFYMLRVAVFILALMLAPADKAHAAAALTVNTLADNETDDALCTLREAVTAANNNANFRGCTSTGYGADTITFSVSGTILLGESLPPVTAAGGALTINGSGHSITISGNNTVKVFSVLADAALALRSLTIANANVEIGGGGVWSMGSLTITNCAFSNNHAFQGGGISAVGGTLTVSSSTFSGNSATNNGGGIYNNGTLTLTNSTFSGNSTSYGGGIYNGGTATISSSTFSGNSATANMAAVIDNGGTLTVTNSIIANSPVGRNCRGAFTNGGHNIDDGTTCGWGSTNSSKSSINPLLGALANNGGSTRTMALLPGSPAVNAGDDSLCPATDQRGISRPQGLHCDIGAFEVVMVPFYLPLVLRR